jgi:hypothetical protein
MIQRKLMHPYHSPRCPRPTVALAHGYSQGFSQENALSLRIVMMVELIRAGLATAKAERVVAWSRTFEVARVRITTPHDGHGHY